jgi:hypothetical protein
MKVNIVEDLGKGIKIEELAQKKDKGDIKENGTTRKPDATDRK